MRVATGEAQEYNEDRFNEVVLNVQRVGMISEKNLNPVAYCCEGDRTVVSGVDETLTAAKQLKYVGLSIFV